MMETKLDEEEEKNRNLMEMIEPFRDQLESFELEKNSLLSEVYSILFVWYKVVSFLTYKDLSFSRLDMKKDRLGVLHYRELWKSKGGAFYDKLGAEVGTQNPINGALVTVIDRLSWFLACRLSFTRTTPKISYFGAWSAPSAVAVNLAILPLRRWRQRFRRTKRCNRQF